MNMSFHGPKMSRIGDKKSSIALFRIVMIGLIAAFFAPNLVFASTPSRSGNLILDPGFESGGIELLFNGAFRGLISLDSTESLTGSSSLRFIANNDLAFTTPWRLSSESAVTAVSGEQAFELSAWVKADSVDQPVRMFIFCLDAAYDYQIYPFVARNFVADTNWQRISMAHTCPDGSSFASFRLQVDTAGTTAWWDDLSFSRTSASGSNLLANGGFETGSPEAPMAGVWKGSIAIDSTEALVGQYSLRHDSSAKSSYTNPYRVSPEAAVVALGAEGGTFSLSAWAKSSSAGSQVRLRLFCLDETYEYDANAVGTGTFSSDTQWRPMTLTHTCAPGAKFISMRLEIVGDGKTVWWDEVRLQDETGLLNHLPDPDFESGTLQRPFASAFQGVPAVDNSVSLTGSSSLRLAATQNNDAFTGPWNGSPEAAVIALEGESTLRFSAWAKADVASVPVQMRIFCLDETFSHGVSNGKLSQTVGTGWEQLILDHTCPEQSSFAGIRVDVDQNGRTVWWDAMQMTVLASSPGQSGGGENGGNTSGPSACDSLSPGSRDWASLGEGTLLSDQGSPLRGVWWSLDRNVTRAPTAAEIAEVKNRGLNTIHVYAERPGQPPSNCQNEVCCQIGDPDFEERCWAENTQAPGYSQEALCELVSEAAEQDLYVVITIGDSVVNPDGGDWVRAFWTKYAAIFSNQKNVVFEIKNESIGAPPAVWEGQYQWIREYHRDSYQIIRANSTEVPVLMFSYAFFTNPTGALEDIAWLNQNVPNIDWTRTAIAFHGYGTLAETQASVDAVRGAGYSVIETEGTCPVDSGPDGSGECLPPNFLLLEQHENHRISWMSFLNLNGATESTFNIPMENEGFIWAADEGTWPGSSNPPTGAVISLRGPFNDSYVSVDPANGELVADSAQAVASSRFEVVAMGRYVALRSEANGLYVRPSGSDQQLKADTTQPYAFEWIDRPDGQVTLQATGTWLFVSAGYTPSNPSAPAPLKADRKRGGLGWEGFEWEANGGDPIVTLQQPSSSGVVKAGNNVAVSASVTHPAGIAINRVDFHYGSNGSLIRTDTSAPYVQTLSSNGQAHNSQWTVYAVAHDVDGGMDTSSSVTLQFDAQAPNPTIVSPGEGATVSGVVPVSVGLGGATDIASVQLFVDGALEDSATGPFQLQWDTDGFTDGPHTLKVKAFDQVGHMGESAQVSVTLDNTVPPLCQPDANTLCLQDRFAVTLDYPTSFPGDGRGDRVDFSEEAGFFSFFQPDNYEVMVKIVDGRCAGAGNGTHDHWWLYYGGLTDIPYTLSVTDMLTSLTKQYTNSPDALCGGADTQFFTDACPSSSATTPLTSDKAAMNGLPNLGDHSGLDTRSSSEIHAGSEIPSSSEIRWSPGFSFPAGAAVEGQKSGSCVANNSSLCLHDGRISVTVDWSTGSSSGDGQAIPVAGNGTSGLFWFFAPGRLEMAVKVIDGETFNGNWWVYFGVLTDVDYTVTVTDTMTGAFAQYDNGQLPTYCGIADISAIDMTP